MNPLLSRTAVWLVAGWCATTTLRAQAPEVQNDFRNIHSLQPSLAWPPPPPGVTAPTGDKVPTPGQWRSTTVLGGWISTRLHDGTSVLAGAQLTTPGDPGNFVLPSAAATGNLPGVSLASALIGRPMVARNPTVYFGDEITRPDKDAFGNPLANSLAYYLAKPAVTNGTFHFSEDAQAVFATQPGPVDIVWNLRVPSNGVSSVTNTYYVSGSPNPRRGGAKRILWTARGYRGPPVRIPEGPIKQVKVLYNSQIPASVSAGQIAPSPYLNPNDPTFNQVVSGTIWYSATDSSLHAYNREGLVAIELLGALNGETQRRQHLGIEVVQVIREISPQSVRMDVGDKFLPVGTAAAAVLKPRPVNGVESNFVFSHGVPSRNESEYYAIRTTTPTVPAFQPTGEVLFYWMKTGMLDLLWPEQYTTYVITWPEANDTKYTRYIRQNSSAGDASATGILLDSANSSTLVFQDDPSANHAKQINGNWFYTNLGGAKPNGYALIKHTNGETIWFERVWSQLNTAQPSYTNLVNHPVGARINAPLGYEDAVGYIRQSSGNAFDPTAYIDPFVAGVDAARQGAIIPVNALDANRQLEVWWYRKSIPPAHTSVKPHYYPAAVTKYTLAWPANPDRIVLASNEGSGDLNSLEAAGTVYVQNNSLLAGFNPNDEHALMLAGRLYALRDDLGTTTTSDPYSLLRYTAADGRPAMRVFEVVRDDPDQGISFDYAVEAGRVLQAPMPLPLLPPVLGPDKTPANMEVQPAAQDVPTNTGTAQHYRRFTFTDRKATTWVYRGPHVTEATDAYFSMQYYYPAQEGFFVPGENLVAGTAMPYLRAVRTNLTDGVEYYVGNKHGVDNQAMRVHFRPRWPEFAPTLELGETLTLPTRGLPAVRGQTSLEILYDQSLARSTSGKSATLFDPTVAKTYALSASTLAKLPSSVFTSTYNGRVYFPNLPPHLVERFYFDPNLGPKGSLVFKGEFKDEVFGDDYLLLNVMSAKDLADVKALCDVNDTDKQKWFTAVEGLACSLNMKVENADLLGTFVASGAYRSARSASIWNFIREKSWTKNFTVPSSASMRGNNGIRSDDDVNPAIQWMRAHHEDLVNWKQAETAWYLEKNSLGAEFTSYFLDINGKKPTSKSLSGLAAESRYRYTDDPIIPIIYYYEPEEADRLTYEAREFVQASYLNAIVSADPQWAAPLTPSQTNFLSTARAYITYSGSYATQTVVHPDDPHIVPGLLLVTNGSLLRKDSSYYRTGHISRAGNFIHNNISKLEKLRRGATTGPDSVLAIENALKADFVAFDASTQKSVGINNLVEITNSDFPVDSYALTAEGGGEGHVVLISGNSRALTPEAEPVSLHIIRVTKPLARGQMKVIQPSNPLSEKLTLQHSLDFAGHPENYEFEWRTLPVVEGSSPVVYSFTSETAFALGSWTTTATNGNASTIGLPGQVFVEKRADKPETKLTRSFNLTGVPFRSFLSLSLSALGGAKVQVNGHVVAQVRMPGVSDTLTVEPPLPSFDPLPLVYEVPTANLKNGSNTITVTLASAADVGAAILLDVKMESLRETDASSAWLAVGPNSAEVAGTQPNSVQARNRYVVEGNSLFTLTDNYFICRHRPVPSSHVAHGDGWSKWTEPQLAEGWIKRALAGINPFEQRVKDLYNNDVNTDVSLVTQAGKRWAGDIALNLQNIDDFGLIEIYETILRRGKSLSIEGAPAINYGPANQALLLAAGYLNDLYTLLGNEAYADAANPTIAFSTEGGDFGDISTSLFSFKGQLATVLDEELSLLRGRDDFLAPGSRVNPVFNRLVWNYTRGIDSGEAIYALNYNIKDLDQDGVVGAADAARAYPQGHGDAYGHYLTALTGYYTLLWNDSFSWLPQTEEVLVLGQRVAVDYLDERKFAATAAAWTKTAMETLDLTYRQAFKPSNEELRSWAHLRDSKPNPATATTLRWGVDDWSVRGGQGAYFHWLTANSMLPAVDPNPAHEGIQKIDRTTVPEIAQVAGYSEQIQRSLDRASAGLNPLGLSRGAVPFDISPAEIDQGRTHFEQVYNRAVAALANASAAFNSARSVTRLLRSQDDSLEERREAIFAQERAYNNQLKELYGTPYADDIGPGKTYPQGYAGADLVNYLYIEFPELFKNSTGPYVGLQTQQYVLAGSTDFSAALDKLGTWTTNTLNQSVGTPNEFKDRDLDSATNRVRLIRFDHTTMIMTNEVIVARGTSGEGLKPIGKAIHYTFDVDGRLHKPSAWTGRRAHPGKIQKALAEAMSARLDLHNKMDDYGNFGRNAQRLFRNFASTVRAHDDTRKLLQARWAEDSVFGAAVAAIDGVNAFWESGSEVKKDYLEAAEKAFPTVNGLANDVTSAARSSFITAKAATTTMEHSVKAWLNALKLGLEQAHANVQRDNDMRQYDTAWINEHLQLLAQLKDNWVVLEDGSRAVDLALRAYHDALDQVNALVAEGNAIQDDRAAFRRRAAAVVRGYRTRDFGFRSFRNEALESYKSLFDLAARYTYLAARAYDFETGLVDADKNATAGAFFQSIVRSRALGVITAGVPQPAGAQGGDPGLSGALARMNSDWAVVKSRFGLNNPDRYRTAFSLRREFQRIRPGVAYDADWKAFLKASYKADILQDPDVRKNCLNVNSGGALAVPGLVVEFPTTINTGFNFFGKALAGGDSTYSPSSFATKIRAAGIAFPGYIGMAFPTSLGGPLAGTGATSPVDPGTAFTDPNGLSATPYIYLVPVGDDSIRSPVSSDANVVRTWKIEDQAIPLPFDIGGAFSTTTSLSGLGSLSESFTLRKHQAFRAVPDGTVFSSAPGFTNARLVGRSVWNSRWKLVIPGHTLKANPVNGLDIFGNTVKDIILYFETYSNAGN